MRTRLALGVLALLAVSVLAGWTTPNVAESPENALPAVQAAWGEEAGSCPAAKDGAGPEGTPVEFCWTEFCGGAGIRCVWKAGGQCGPGVCHYKAVTDPSCTADEGGPSCRVGC